LGYIDQAAGPLGWSVKTFKEKGTTDRINSVSSLAAMWRRPTINMKRITLSILCLSVAAVSAFAEDTSTPAADNSARNQRDRSGETQTSGDQSNSSPNIKTTAAIRRAIMHDDSLSMMAKNVKIIAENGAVTLRGPVKSAAEKAKITQLAQNAAQGAKIDNQLEVRSSE
jgi:hyperosmotically inducible periplasmic protein